MNIYEILSLTGLPVAYGVFRDGTSPPFILYLGNGQEAIKSDDTFATKQNAYQVEYYFTEKNEITEELIESTLLQHGYLYEKSEDIYNPDDDVYMIYYYI